MLWQEVFIRQVIIGVFVVGVFLAIWVYTAFTVRSRFPALRKKTVLLLIAHPDDEAMFFAPTLLALTQPELENHVKILCLSSGNADNLGSVRRQEILASALILGLRSQNDVMIYDHPDFPDSMSANWDPAKISFLLSTMYGTKSASQPQTRKSAQDTRLRDEAPSSAIDVLITFDEQGVSSHKNHKALHHGAVTWTRDLMKGKAGWDCPVTLYTLTSTDVIRKYMSVFDAPFTMILSALETLWVSGRKAAGLPPRLVFLSGPGHYRVAQQAMTEAHQSQMVWFRWGWIAMSRYMALNDLKKEAAK